MPLASGRGTLHPVSVRMRTEFLRNIGAAYAALVDEERSSRSSSSISSISISRTRTSDEEASSRLLSLSDASDVSIEVHSSDVHGSASPTHSDDGSDDDDDDDDDDSPRQQPPPPPPQVGAAAGPPLPQAAAAAAAQRQVVPFIESPSEHERRRARGGSAPPPPPSQPADDADDGAPRCLICVEHLPFIANEASASAMEEHVTRFRRIIYDYEAMLVGRVPDERIFADMLCLRREHVERHLDVYSAERYERWTLGALRAHYDPFTGHQFNYVRTLDAQLQDLGAAHRMLMHRGLVIDDDGVPKPNFLGFDRLVRVSKALTDVARIKAHELRERTAASATTAQLILQAAESAGSMSQLRRKRPRAVAADANGASAAASMYALGTCRPQTPGSLAAQVRARRTVIVRARTQVASLRV